MTQQTDGVAVPPPGREAFDLDGVREAVKIAVTEAADTELPHGIDALVDRAPMLLAEVERLRAEPKGAVATVTEQAQRLTTREREHNADRAELEELRARVAEPESRVSLVAAGPRTDDERQAEIRERWTGALYDSIHAFQMAAQITGLQHAQMRGYLAEHLRDFLLSDEGPVTTLLAEVRAEAFHEAADVATETANAAERRGREAEATIAHHIATRLRRAAEGGAR